MLKGTLSYHDSIRCTFQALHDNDNRGITHTDNDDNDWHSIKDVLSVSDDIPWLCFGRWRLIVAEYLIDEDIVNMLKTKLPPILFQQNSDDDDVNEVSIPPHCCMK